MLKTVFQTGGTTLHSYQQGMRTLIPPHPCRHLILSVLLIIAILLVVGCEVIPCVLVCISLITNDIEHLLMCLFIICILFFKGFIYI